MQQLRWLQTRPQMSPCWVGVTGNAKPSREQLRLDPCASSLDILCPLAAGAGLGAGAAPRVPSRRSSLVTFGWSCLCPSRAIPGTAELLDCWKLSRKEALFPLGLPGATLTSEGCRGGHLPGTNTSRCVDYFSRVQWPWSVWLVTQSFPPHRGGGGGGGFGLQQSTGSCATSRWAGREAGGPWRFVPGSLRGVPVGLGAPDLPPVPLPGLSLCGFSGDFFLSLSYLPSFSPNPCPSPSVGLNKQSLNTPVCVGGVDADGVCGPHGLTMSPALQQDVVPRGCPGAEEEEGTALVPTASAHPGAGKWLGVPVLGVLEDKDNCLPPLLPLLQGPVPLMWPNRGDQGEQELGAAGAQLPSPLELGQPSSLHRSPALVGTS